MNLTMCFCIYCQKSYTGIYDGRRKSSLKVSKPPQHMETLCFVTSEWLWVLLGRTTVGLRHRKWVKKHMLGGNCRDVTSLNQNILSLAINTQQSHCYSAIYAECTPLTHTLIDKFNGVLWKVFLRNRLHARRTCSSFQGVRGEIITF